MKKRLIDINPPPKAADEVPVALAEPRSEGESMQLPRPSLALGVLLLILFAAPFPVLHLLFARATVQLWPQMTTLHMEEAIVAQVGHEDMDVERKIIRARMFDQEAERTMRFPASGSKFKEERARGTIRVYNEYSTKPQTLVANTRFISEDGNVFRSESTITVPGGTSEGRGLRPGFIDVQVIASESGEAYNIKPSNFSLPGLVGTASYTKIYGESSRAMAGGADREVAVVTDEDISSAQDQLEETLKAEAIKNLLAKVPPPFQVLQDSLDFEVLEDNALVKPGAELDEFTYGAKVRITMAAFDKDNAGALAKELLTLYAGPNQALREETLSLEYVVSSSLTQAGVIPMTIKASVDQYTKLNEQAFVNDLRGVSTSQFGELMRKYPFFAKTEVALWPFWFSAVPNNAERIELETILKKMR